MSRLFISHSSADDDFVARLAIALSKAGLAVWVDDKDIPAGIYWSNAVQEGLDVCEVLLLVISPDAIASENVALEWQYFRDTKRPILPIMWKQAELGFELRRLQFIDFTNQDFEVAFEKLLRDLEMMGYELNRATTDTIDRNKTGNIFWLCHDMLELHRWLLEGIPKQWLDIGLRQTWHHATETRLDGNLTEKLRILRDTASAIQEHEWTKEKRERYAGEVRILFNAFAQIIQNADPNFDPGPG